MLKIDRNKNTFLQIQSRSLANADLLERQHLQEFIFNSSEAFFEDVGHPLFLIGKEIVPSEVAGDRIDLLGIAPDGAAVIVELKRGNDKLQLLQALSYAAMVSKWQPEDLLASLSEDQKQDLQEFLEGRDLDDLNRSQRVILVAEAFDYEVLVTAEWLVEQYDVDVLCIRITLATDEAVGAEYLSCSQVYPAPEIEDQAIRRKAARRSSAIPVRELSEVLAACENLSVREFFEKEMRTVPVDNQNNLVYWIGSRKRWEVSVREAGFAYVWQRGRFEGDEDLWRKELSRPEDVEPKDTSERCLRFRLYEERDFDFFLKFYNERAPSLDWVRHSCPN